MLSGQAFYWFLRTQAKEAAGNGAASHGNGVFAEITETSELGREDFKELLGKIDKGLRSLPATAQVGSAV